MVTIEYVKWGLANRFSDPDVIEMNEALKTNMKLHNAILEHEYGHKETNDFKKDFIHDITPINKFSQKEVLIFMLKHPKTFTQLLPFYWSPKRRKLIYDLNMLILYGISLIVIVLGIIIF